MKFWYNPNFLAIFLLILLSIPALKSLATPGFYTSHDGETHTARIAQYYIALKDRQFPPRFASTFYNGLGSPIFVYIYPLPYLLGAVIHSINLSYSDTFKILMSLGFIFSGIFTYLWLKETFKSTSSAFLGSLFYMWVPYRFSLIYVRGSISELLAYTFVPLTLFFITKLFNSERKIWIPLVAISFALILLSQNLVAVLFAPVIGLYILALLLFKRSKKVLFLSVVSLLWGGVMASITYLPSLLERGFVRFDETISGNYVTHFVTLKQLFYSPWGYGFDLPGTVGDQLSFQIGLAQILVIIFSIGVFVSVLFRSKTSVARKNIALSAVFLIVIAVSVFLMTASTYSLYIWQHTFIWKLIDIPWRLLGLVALSSSFLTAFVASYTKPKIFLVLLITLVIILNRNHLRINQSLERSDQFFDEYTGTATQYNEFTPKWRQTTRVPIGFDFNIKTQTLNGQADVQVLRSDSNSMSLIANVKSPQSTIAINKFYFPGLVVNVDGKNLEAFKDYPITDANNLSLEKDADLSGLPSLNLPAGNHQVDLSYNETPLRLFADLLSLVSFFLALATIVLYAKK